jgi:peptidoglycan/LPS O-acetylase OafA/YrhL
MKRPIFSSFALVVASFQLLVLVVILLVTLVGITLTGEFDGWVNLVAEIIIYLLAIAGYLVVVRGLRQQKSWAYAPAIAVQLIVIGIAYEDFWQDDTWYWRAFGVVLAITSIAAIVAAAKESKPKEQD